jgi:PAS domain S-box-containing protein
MGEGDDKAQGRALINILLVDDTPAKLIAYQAALAELGQNLLTARSIDDALGILVRTDVALIVTDVYMPGGDGFQLAKLVRDHPRFERIPIMFVSAATRAEADHLRALSGGVIDYVTVPTAELLRAKVKIFIELFSKERELARLKEELEARVDRRTKRLAESEERYRSLVDEANDIVATLDLDFRFTSVNPAVERILGYSQQEFVGTTLREHVPPDQLTMHDAMLREKLEGKSSTTYEMQIFSKGRQRLTLEVNSKLIRDEEGKPSGIHAIARDVTERKQAEARQTVLIRELQHRTKNLLAVIQSIVTNTLDRTTSAARAKEAIIGRLHALSRAQEFVASGASGGVPLRELVDAELSAFATQVSVEGIPVVLGGPFAQQFALVLHELATNAAKYGSLSVSNGRLVIRWHIRQSDEPLLVFSWQERDGPRVERPLDQGFGSRLIGSALHHEPNVKFDPRGFEFSIAVPMSEVMQPTKPR